MFSIAFFRTRITSKLSASNTTTTLLSKLCPHRTIPNYGSEKLPSNPSPNSNMNPNSAFSSSYSYGSSVPSAYDLPFESSLKFNQRGGGGGGNYVDENSAKYGNLSMYGRTQSDIGSDFYNKKPGSDGVLYDRSGLNDNGTGDGVYAYDGGKIDPYGARGTSAKSSIKSIFDDYGRSISFSPEKDQVGSAKVVRAVPKVEAQQYVINDSINTTNATNILNRSAWELTKQDEPDDIQEEVHDENNNLSFSVKEKTNYVEIIVINHERRTTPSFVAFTDSELLIEDTTMNKVATNPINIVSDARRLIGRRLGDPIFLADIKHWPLTTSTTVGGERFKLHSKSLMLSHPSEPGRQTMSTEEKLSFTKINLPYHQPIKDKFFPSTFTSNPSSICDLSFFINTIKHENPWLESLLHSTRVVLFRGFPANTASDFHEVDEAFGYEEFPRVDEAAFRKNSWPELLPLMFRCVPSDNPSLQESRPLAIGFVIALATTSVRAPNVMRKFPQVISRLFAILTKMLLDMKDNFVGNLTLLWRIISWLSILMEGFKSLSHIVFIGATTRPKGIDQTSRFRWFDKEIDIGVPDEVGRVDVFRIHTTSIKLAANVDLDKVTTVIYCRYSITVKFLTKKHLVIESFVITLQDDGRCRNLLDVYSLLSVWRNTPRPRFQFTVGDLVPFSILRISHTVRAKWELRIAMTGSPYAGASNHFLHRNGSGRTFWGTGS